MGFIDVDPDFTRALFTVEDLEVARRHLPRLIEEIIPGWLRRPEGYLASPWTHDGLAQIAQVIEFSRMTQRLLTVADSKMRTVLRGKIRQILSPAEDKLHTEVMAELHTAYLIAKLTPHLELDPLVAEDKIEDPDRPPTPDMKATLPDGEVMLEVTVFHFGELERWKRTTENLWNQLDAKFGKARKQRGKDCGFFRLIDMRLPLNFASQDVSNRLISLVHQRVSRNPTGSLALDFDGEPGSVEWRPFPEEWLANGGLRVKENLDAIPRVVSWQIKFEATDANERPPFVVASIHRLTNAAEKELILRSLRSTTLERKRKQYTGPLPYLLVIELSSHFIPLDIVIHLFSERIWPNPQYASISGVLLRQPRHEVAPGRHLPLVAYGTNPNAKVPAPLSFKKELEKVWPRISRTGTRDG